MFDWVFDGVLLWCSLPIEDCGMVFGVLLLFGVMGVLRYAAHFDG